MIKDITIESPPTTGVAEYTPIAAALAAARARYQDVVWDLTTTRGNEEARRARRELVSLRTGLESRRKELKAPLLAQAKLVDDEAKRITAELLQLEEPIDALIRADERRREEERAAREAAERARVATIQAKIKAIMDQPINAVRIRSSALLQTAIDNLAAQEISTDEFEEFAEGARLAHAEALIAMQAMLSEIREREAQAQRDAAAAAERAEAERQAREAQEAEARRLAAERAEFERQQADARAAQEAQAARLAAQQAEIERQAAELRAQQEEAARAAEAAADAQEACEPAPEPAPVAATPVAALPSPMPARPRPSDDQIIEALSLRFRVHELTVIAWLLDMDLDAASKRAAANL